MSSTCDCPICMEPVEASKNCVTTECGHTFHSNCLMTSVAHNGFRCPYCRTDMAQVPNEEEEEDEDEGEGEGEGEGEDDEYALRGFRFFMNNINSEEHSDEDIIEEDVYLQYQENDEPEPNLEHLPTCEFITRKLVEQGVTMENIVKTLLVHHEQYDLQNEQLERAEDELFGKMCIIISNLTPSNV